MLIDPLDVNLSGFVGIVVITTVIGGCRGERKNHVATTHRAVVRPGGFWQFSFDHHA
jgi:hypothetical protein